MANTGQKISASVGKITGKLTDMIEKHSGVLLALGLVHQAEGGGYKVAPVISKAGAKMFGLGKDDEAIATSIIGQVAKDKNNGHAKAQALNTWYGGLKDFQKRELRMWLAQKLAEFSTFPKDSQDQLGMLYAIDFFIFLAELGDDDERTKTAIAWNIFPQEPRLLDEALEAINSPSDRAKVAAAMQDRIDKIKQKQTVRETAATTTTPTVSESRIKKFVRFLW
ncbi:MAG TPA: hypothetical protein PLH37_03365 [bacterium]|nr:hypothetical protein [bacterium]